MKTRALRPDENKLELKQGQARFYRRAAPKSRWKRPDEPIFHPNWLVRFSVCGKSWEVMPEQFPVAEGLGNVRVWAKEMILSQAAALQRGAIDEAAGMRKSPKIVKLAELIQAYLQHVPPGKPDYAKNAGRLKAIMEETTGLTSDAIEVTDAVFSRKSLLGWARMRQEYFRRGWTGHGKAPANAWETLREELTSGKLPGLDKTTVMEGNTTIQTYIRCAKTVFANHGEYLVGLQLPLLKEFLTFSVDVAMPEGHREIPEASLSKLDADLSRLRKEEPKVWAFHQLTAWTGARPATIKRLTGAALKVVPVPLDNAGDGELSLPITKGGKPILWPLPMAVVNGILDVMTPASLIGARHKTEGDKIHRAHCEWMTANGITGTHKSYMLRHARGQQLRSVGGIELAAAGLGHTTTAMVERKYTESQKAMPMIDPRKRAG